MSQPISIRFAMAKSGPQASSVVDDYHTGYSKQLPKHHNGSANSHRFGHGELFMERNPVEPEDVQC